MSEEAPKKIEERLQRYAKKRREQGGDFSLHPATRRLLQGEVAQRHDRAGKPRPSWLAWFGLWRGRFAFGVGAVAVLVLSTWLVWNNQQPGQPMRLARNELVADGEQSAREKRAMKASGPAAEAGKQSAIADAPRPSDESRDGVSRKVPSLALAAPTISLTPALNSSAGAQASDFLPPANGAGPSTNFFAYTVPKAASLNNRAMSPDVPGVQLGYFDNMKTDRSGLAPATQPAGRLTGVEAPSSARFRVAATGTSALGGNALYANGSQAKEVTANLAIADQKRLAESSDPQSRSAVGNAQTESLALGVNRSAVEEGLARNRRMNVNQPGAAGGAQGKNVVDSLALADSPLAAPAEAKAKADVALNLPAQAAGELRGGSSIAPRFFRQAQADQLGEIAQMERGSDLLKKAEKPVAASPVLDRFTVEQQGGWLRIREPDGSVYEGPITGPVVAASADTSGARDKDALLREKDVTFKSSPAYSDGEYSFRASGSNVTLRQMIVVNGRLSTANDSIAPTAGAAAPAPAPLRRALTPAASGRGGGTGVVTNRISRMEGTVRVGAANEQQFKAVRATR